MQTQTSAIFVDWDNVFGGLFGLDPSAARQIAQNPEIWMRNLVAQHQTDGSERRWLIRRCYMNPAGWVLDIAERLYFSRFRPFFVRAGFEVVDCPQLTRNSKNAADIRIALDAMDVLGSAHRPDEIVIASSDSDFTPLLHRIRSQDCRITLITTGDSVAAYRSLADHVLDAPAFLELLSDQPEEDEEEQVAPESSGEKLLGLPSSREFTEEQLSESRKQFAAFVTSEYETADEPINLARFSVSARQQLGSVAKETGWFGAGSFTGALRRIGLAGMEINQHYVWDSQRHDPPPPSPAAVKVDPVQFPDTIAQIMAVTDLPRIDHELWPEIYRVLAEYAAEHAFNLTESTKWARDRLAEQGFVVGRSAVTFALQGAARGGAFDVTSASSADTIGSAFYTTVLQRARAVGLIIDLEQREELRGWLGAADSNSDEPDVVASPLDSASASD